MSQEPIKVAVLGGGIAGLTAAYELTRTKELQRRYQVTVYTQGWRLGGKGASGRAHSEVSGAEHHRIHEHGLHVWFGFYANALALMKDCLTEQAKVRKATSRPMSPHRKLDDAFKAINELVLVDGDEAVCLPLPDSEVGEPFFTRLPRWVVVRLRGLAIALSAVIESTEDGDAGAREIVKLAAFALSLAELEMGHDDPGRYKRVADQLETNAGEVFEADAGPRAKLMRQLTFFWAAILRGLGKEILPELPPRDGAPHPFDAMNGEELRAWLGRHGQLEEFTEAPFLRALYDLVFAYPGGNVERGEMAAGVAVENILSMVRRNGGTLMMKMRGGMGDVIFGPLFEVLRHRGVRFRFFHAVTELGLEGRRISSIKLIRQAELIRRPELVEAPWTEGPYALDQERDNYEPLVPYDKIRNGLRCWPDAPLTAQLAIPQDSGAGVDDKGRLVDAKGDVVDFERDVNPIGGTTVTLKSGRDFEHIVLAIPVAALGWPAPDDSGPGVTYEGPCRHLMKADRENPRDPLDFAKGAFAAMVLNANPVMTHSFQVWLNRSRDDVGWPHHWATRAPWLRRVESILGRGLPPFETMCDMTHLIDLEGWAHPKPKQLAYFCGVLYESKVTEDWRAADAAAMCEALRFLRRHADRKDPPFREIWRTFDKADLHDLRNRSEWEERFKAQHWRANTTRSERYSAPFIDAVKSRLDPDDSGFDDLVLAGDWTRTQVNAGCVEAAVMSGMLAAAGLVYEGDPARARLPVLPSWRAQSRTP